MNDLSPDTIYQFLHRKVICSVLFLSVFIVCPDAFSDCSRLNSVTVPLVETEDPLTTDLNSFPWTQAAKLTGLHDIDTGKMAQQPTWIYLFYDKHALRVAYRCSEPTSWQLTSATNQRDGPVWRGDSIELFCDPEHTHKDFFQFIVNPGEALYDAQGTNAEWNAQEHIQAATDAKGWTLALRIPFSALGQGSPEINQVWAVNFGRSRPEKERLSWALTIDGFGDAANFGHLVFGGKARNPIRFAQIGSPFMGSNEFLLENQQGIEYSMQGLDWKNDVLFAQNGEVTAEGEAEFNIENDQANRLFFDFKAKQGAPQARFSLPMSSPSVSHRLPPLKESLDAVKKTLGNFPAETRENARALYTEIQDSFDEANGIVRNVKQASRSSWERLDEIIRKCEIDLDLLGSYGKTLRHFPKAQFAVGLESPMRKVMIKDFPFRGWFADHYDLSLAKNEHEGFQVVVMPFKKALQNVSVDVLTVSRTDESEPTREIDVNVSLVGHVQVSDNPPYKVDYQGWWPDPLLDFQQSCDIQVGEHVAFWIDVYARETAPAGDYEAKIHVSANSCPPVELRLNIQLWDFQLPQGSHLRNAFTYHIHGARRIHGDDWNREMEYRYYDFILEHRLNIDHLYRGKPEEIEVLNYGVARGMNAFNICQTNSVARIDKVIDDYVPQLKAAGLYDMAYVYGFDEVKEDRYPEIKEVFGEIHRRFPDLKTMTTAVDRSFGKESGLRDVVDIWVPLTPSYDLQEAEQLRREGKEVWWYICVVPVHPYANWFIEYPTIESRLLTGTMSYKYQVDGFLYYLINLWDRNKRPISSGPYTDWFGATFENRRGEIPNGDGSLLCAGPEGPLSTIRLENVRDGLDDYEYLHLLQETVNKVRALDRNQQREEYIELANRLLTVPDNVVKTTTAFTLDPQNVQAYREKVAEAILKGKAFLERP